MWSVQSDKIKQHKKRVNYTINKHTIDRFKIVADKDMRKMSNIVGNLIEDMWKVGFSFLFQRLYINIFYIFY